ncbi:MAG: T9SS type A sorting domain-containing protein [Bacteroidetes bacterium]|nr:T9SS type A sorting domain-containing protein [Bacteroidota bacterium]
MKTTKIYIVVCLTFILTQFTIYAQYNGGNSNGATINNLNANSCSVPSHFYAYFGGLNDGSSVNELSTATCGTAAFQFAYLGGISDGATTEEFSSTTCSTPPSFYAYFGGINDGAAVENFEANVCSFPSQFYAYFGGQDDGFTLDKTAPICPTQPPVASFTASTTEICVGQTVTFTDTSTNIPSAWTWTFAGGTPGTSTDQNPVITFNTAGSYAVTLVAANFNGTDIETITGYITVIAYPTVTSVTPASRCGNGTVILQATASAGALSWYANPTGGTALATGTSFTTPTISTTTTYYVETVNGTCTSTRIPVIATVNATPSITSTTPASRCGTGNVTLQATASLGTISWYSAATGGTALATGGSFVTPSLTATTTYYVEAANGTCVSPRTAVIATVNTMPSVLTTTPATRCDAGTVTLGATTSSGTLNWYSSSSGGSSLGTGTSFITPSLTTTTIYYVDASTISCTSVRTAVIATVNATPIVTGTTNSRCDAGTVTLNASATVGTLNWYANASGGSVLGTGTSFTTPSISTTTTYYVESVNGVCTSVRTAVIATVNSSPTITSTTPGSRCGTGSITLQATANSGTISWYATATGGTALATGGSFVTPSLAATTTYYVEANNGTCNSSRTAIVATINTTPTITSTTPASRCGTGSVTLQATANSGTISWYATAVGGTALATGGSFVTPSLTATTTYYVESNNGTCNSSRTAIVATISQTASPTGIANQTFCQDETVGLIAVLGSNVIWYDAAIGGNIVTSTTAISTGTTYYASQTVSGCESSTRLAVTMTLGSCLGTEDFVKLQISVYPNPTRDLVNVVSNQLIEKVEVINILGQTLISNKFTLNEVILNLDNLPTATYVLRVTSENNVINTFKIVKR